MPYSGESTSPLWSRDYTSSCTDSYRVFKWLGIRKIFGGHTPTGTANHGMVHEMCGGRLVIADTGMSRAYRQAFGNAKITVVVVEYEESSDWGRAEGGDAVEVLEGAAHVSGVAVYEDAVTGEGVSRDLAPVLQPHRPEPKSSKFGHSRCRSNASSVPSSSVSDDGFVQFSDDPADFPDYGDTKTVAHTSTGSHGTHTSMGSHGTHTSMGSHGTHTSTGSHGTHSPVGTRGGVNPSTLVSHGGRSDDDFGPKSAGASESGGIWAKLRGIVEGELGGTPLSQASTFAGVEEEHEEEPTWCSPAEGESEPPSTLVSDGGHSDDDAHIGMSTASQPGGMGDSRLLAADEDEGEGEGGVFSFDEDAAMLEVPEAGDWSRDENLYAECIHNWRDEWMLSSTPEDGDGVGSYAAGPPAAALHEDRDAAYRHCLPPGLLDFLDREEQQATRTTTRALRSRDDMFPPSWPADLRRSYSQLHHG